MWTKFKQTCDGFLVQYYTPYWLCPFCVKLRCALLGILAVALVQSQWVLGASCVLTIAGIKVYDYRRNIRANPFR
jgi:disulfide bond formation protein DsbB